MAPRIAIAGASLGGLRTLEALANAGFDPATIAIIGDEPHRPYNRPPLSKELVTDPKAEGIGAAFGRVAFRVRPELEAARWHLGIATTGLSLATRHVALADGTQVPFDVLVAATGLIPRRLPFAGAWADRIAVHKVEDSQRLRAALKPGARVVVAGGGFVGCEVAAVAAGIGCRVVLVSRGALPMSRVLGAPFAAAMLALHRARGVEAVTGAQVAGIETHAGDRLAAVVLSTGDRLEADVLVEAIGSDPAVGWMAGNGLDLSDGLLCTNDLVVAGHDDLYAVGDIARFPNPLFDAVPRRVEHWCMPGFTARRVAEGIAARFLGKAAPEKAFAPLPTFWSDQHGLRLQAFGLPALGDESEVLEGSLAGAQGILAGVAVGYRRAGKPVGVATVGLPPQQALRQRAFLSA